YSVIVALKTVDMSENIIIYTDSKYVINGATIWMKNWKKNILI
ncbi:MAG TPA: ribonuclease HI, partial [Planctomycetes bacterium]|nr:ribonuclease HI [Planctomycetota bacterium]